MKSSGERHPLKTPHFKTLSLSERAIETPASGIGQIVSYARQVNPAAAVISEGDLPTPTFVTEAAFNALLAGETFYISTQGIANLRAAIARCSDRIFGATIFSLRYKLRKAGYRLPRKCDVIPGDEIVTARLHLRTW